MPAPLNIDAHSISAPILRLTPPPYGQIISSSSLSYCNGWLARSKDDPDPHLFILNSTVNRILELKIVPNTGDASTPGTSVAGGARWRAAFDATFFESVRFCSAPLCRKIFGASNPN